MRERRQLRADVAQALLSAGKQVVVTTLALIEAESELATLARTVGEYGGLVEANDYAALDILDGRAFVAGPHLNVYNSATLDLLAEGRLVVLPTVSWHEPEYRALGVSYADRGALLDEHLAAWRVAWDPSPASFAGTHYRFDDVWVEPKPWRPDGVRLWFGSTTLHERLLQLDCRVVALDAGVLENNTSALAELAERFACDMLIVP